MKWLLALALFLFPAWCLAQPVSPNCTTVNASCQAKKFRLIAGNSLCFNSATCTDTIAASATTGGMLFNSGVANSGTNAAYNFDTTNALSGSTLLLNVANHGVSEFTIGQGGSVVAAGGGMFFGNLQTQNNLLIGTGALVYGGGTTIFTGGGPDGAAAVGVRIGSGLNFATAGAKLVVFGNNLQGTPADVAGISLGGSYIAPITDLSGTPGSGTANTPIVLAAFAGTSGATITITDAVSKTTSGCLATLQTIDTTAKDVACVPGNGSFTLTPNATTTGITKVLAILFNGN